jgi:hypothetical protein
VDQLSTILDRQDRCRTIGDIEPNPHRFGARRKERQPALVKKAPLE